MNETIRWNVIYGWKKDLPFVGTDIISISNGDVRNIIPLDILYESEGERKAKTLNEICEKIKTFLINYGSENLRLGFVDTDPLDIFDEAEFILSELSEYNVVEMMPHIHIETFGLKVSRFSTFLSYGPDTIVIKFVVPSEFTNEDEDHSKVERAIECLTRSIEHPKTNDCTKVLKIIINEDSHIDYLKQYFDVISKAFGTDDRIEWAIGAALYSFDIVIQPNTKDLEKVLEAREVLSHPSLNLSQNILVDVTRFL